MRTVIFFGLVSIADAIGKATRWEPTGKVAWCGAIIFLWAILADIVETIKRLND